ncbi:MAG: GNAT family N-acetyltransferase [Woeseiaceae bacterium]|nr:GNAT family N-acetyltransferase [Woeseiaceae bacterium]
MDADGLIIRDVRDSDLDAVLVLNQSEVPHVGSIDATRMRWYADHASYFRVATAGEALAAYLVGFRPGTTYTSPNYLWFCQRYPKFAYVDRVAVAASARRTGIATRLYDDFAAAMPEAVPVMTCEVNVRPANESSMDFHRRLGFEQVGSLTSDDGAKEVAMLLKTLR